MLKVIRDRLKLARGTEVEIGEHDGMIEMRPVSAPVEIVDTPEGPVAAL